MIKCTRKHVLCCTLAVIVSGLLQGCSTLLNPYVRAEELDVAPSDWGLGAARLDNIVNAAIKQRGEYYKAVSERARLRNGLPLLLVPLSAIALRRGITATTDGGRGVVLDMGITSAALYGLGGHYLGSPRERVYMAGALALSCSIRAIEPYMIDAAVFRNDVGSLEAKADEVAGIAARINVVVARHPKDFTDGWFESMRLARSEPGVANAAVRRAHRVAATARKLDGELAIAARNFRWAVERVISQVNTQIEATEPDPSSILRIVGGLKTSATQFAPQPGAAPATAPLTTTSQIAHTQEKKELLEAVNEVERLLPLLHTQTARLITLTNKVNAQVQAVVSTVKSAGADLDACTVPTVAQELHISPTEEAQELRPSQTIQFDVRSNVGIPSASLVGIVRGAGKTKDAAEIVNSVDGNVFRARVTYVEEQADIDDVTVEFCANEKCAVRKQVKLRLEKAAPAPAAPAAAATPAPAPATPPAATTPTTPPATTLPAPTPGTTAPTTPTPSTPTQPAAPSVGPGAPPPAGPELKSPQPAMPRASEEKVGVEDAENQYEKTVVTAALLKRVQHRLQVDQTGWFDRRTRTAIRQFQEAAGLAVDGMLTAELVQRIGI